MANTTPNWDAIDNVQAFFEAPITENFHQMFMALKAKASALTYSTSLILAAAEHRKESERAEANYQEVVDSHNRRLNDLLTLCDTMDRIGQNILPHHR